jgi:hypothetical protein
MSVYSTKNSMLGSSELDFDFDNIVVDSAVYRRVLAAAKRQDDTAKRDVLHVDLADNINSDHMCQDNTAVATDVLSKQPSWQPADDQNHQVEQPQNTVSPAHATRNSDRGSAAEACAKCEVEFGKSEQRVKALGAKYHQDCFTCKVCFV